MEFTAMTYAALKRILVKFHEFHWEIKIFLAIFKLECFLVSLYS